MNLSGIYVLTSIERMPAVVAALEKLPGVSVHAQDPATGRIVATVEAESTEEEVAMLKRIKGIPEVRLAEMVYHYFEDAERPGDAIPPGLDEFEGLRDLEGFPSKPGE